jgi:hypothetical protein
MTQKMMKFRELLLDYYGEILKREKRHIGQNEYASDFLGVSPATYSACKMTGATRHKRILRSWPARWVRGCSTSSSVRRSCRCRTIRCAASWPKNC